MRIAVRTARCDSQRTTWRIHPISDIHDGARDHDYHAFEAKVKEIRDDPYALWIGGGDYGDLIVPGDPRYVANVMDDEWLLRGTRVPDYYLERLTDRLSPIADKCVGLASGNHERTIAQRYHRGVGAELAARLGIPELYLGVRGWSVVRFENAHRRQMPLRIYTWHGWSAGRLKGRKAIQAERELGAWDADVFVLGHDHQPYSDLWYTEECYGSRAGYRVRHRPRAFMNAGSWTTGEVIHKKLNPAKLSEDGDDLWVETRNFRPQPPGGPVLEVDVDMGSGKATGETSGDGYPRNGRPAGFAFTVRMRGQTFHPDESRSSP